ncbi:Imm52 family immunity protein [Micromonospora sp. RB23]
MADLFYVGAYWGPRTESAAECADRLASCLGQIGAVHPALATWFRKGKSKSAASGKPVATNGEALKELLIGGRNRTDVGGDVIDELGFNVALWNKNAVPISFSTTCGASPAMTSIMNYFTLELPAPSDASAELYDPAVARAVFWAVVESWNPRWATFASYSMRATQAGTPGRPVGGWMTYISGVASTSAVENSEVSVERFSNGAVLTAGADPLHVSDAQLAAVTDFISVAG